MNGRMRTWQGSRRRVPGWIDAADDLTRFKDGARRMVAIVPHHLAQLGDDPVVESNRNEVFDRPLVVDNPDADDTGLRQRASRGAYPM